MNKDYPMQTVYGEDAPILENVLPFPEEEEGEPKMDGFPMQTTVGGEEKSDFKDFFFDITQGFIGIIIIMMLAFIAAFMVYAAFAVHRVAWGM